MFNILSDPTQLLFLTVGLLVAVTVHEFMHAWTANYLGDPTPKINGRITLNPLAHLDLLGTITIFIVGFGWGKPVEINPNNFKNAKLGSALTAVAGPLANIVTAALLAIVFKFSGISETFIGSLIFYVISFNLILMIFNLIPIPPLDGSKVLYAILPNSVNIRALEMYGPFFLLFLLLSPMILGGNIIVDILGPSVNMMLGILGLPEYF